MEHSDAAKEAPQRKWRCGRRCLEYQERSREPIGSCRYGPETLADFDLDMPVYLTNSALEAAVLEQDDGLVPLCIPRLRGGEEETTWVESLRGRPITLCPAADEGCVAQLKAWGEKLRPLVRELRWMELPDLLPAVTDNIDDHPGLMPDEFAAVQLTATAWEPEGAIDAGALLARPWAPWLLEGILPAGLTVLTGRPGPGTTSLALQLALLVASGTSPSSAGTVAAGRVLYCALEEPLDLLRPLLQFALGNEPLPDGLSLRSTLPALDDGGVAALRRWAQAQPPGRLVVIDGYERIAPRRADLGIDTLAVLNGLAAEYDLAILAVRRVAHLPRAHHPAAAPNHLLLRQEGARSAELSGRTVRGFVSLPLLWDQVHQRWAVADAGPAAIGASRQAIWNLLVAQGPMTPAEISEALGQPRGTTRSLLSRMTRDRQLIAEDGRYRRGVAAELEGLQQ